MLCKFCQHRTATTPYVFEGTQHFLCDGCHPCTDEPRPALGIQEIAILRLSSDSLSRERDRVRLSTLGSIWAHIGSCVRRRDVAAIADLGLLLVEVADVG